MVKPDQKIKLKQLQDQAQYLEKKLKQKRLQLGGSDGAMQSRYSTGRVELEDEIQILEINLAQVVEEINILNDKKF